MSKEKLKKLQHWEGKKRRCWRIECHWITAYNTGRPRNGLFSSTLHNFRLSAHKNPNVKKYCIIFTCFFHILFPPITVFLLLFLSFTKVYRNAAHMTASLRKCCSKVKENMNSKCFYKRAMTLMVNSRFMVPCGTQLFQIYKRYYFHFDCQSNIMCT